MNLADLPTPCLILDRAKVEANCARVRARAGDLGVTLRPHLKTAKNAEVGRIAHGGDAGPVTVSTLREAEYFLAHGFADITYAVGITPDKFARAGALINRGADLKVVTDEPAIAAALAGHGAAFKVLAEIDCGGGRGGVDAMGDDLIAIGAALGPLLGGVLTHAGHSYACRDGGEIAAVAEHERATVVAAAERLRAAGHACAIVSVGSTPTALFAEDLSGVTEMRPGVYTLMDLFQASIGVCGIEDIAVSVLATVIRHRRDEDTLLIDAGGLALSMDRSTARGPVDYGMGQVCDTNGTAVPDLLVASTNQEHGFVRGGGAPLFERFPLGARLRVLPNHACMTAAAHDRYFVVDGGSEVIGEWRRCNGW